MQLRSYPIPFGLHIQRHWPTLASAGHKIALPREIKEQDATDMRRDCMLMPVFVFEAFSRFFKLPMGDLWPEANLVACCAYVRGGVHLRAPDQWRSVFPHTI